MYEFLAVNTTMNKINNTGVCLSGFYKILQLLKLLLVTVVFYSYEFIRSPDDDPQGPKYVVTIKTT
jgi:hypothetical protein